MTSAPEERKHRIRRNRPGEPGGPPDGFFYTGLTPAELRRVPAAKALEGLDDEIAMLRVRLNTALWENPEELALLLKGLTILVRAVVAQYRLSPRASKQLHDNLAALLDQFADQFRPSDAG